MTIFIFLRRGSGGEFMSELKRITGAELESAVLSFDLNWKTLRATIPQLMQLICGNDRPVPPRQTVSAITSVQSRFLNYEITEFDVIDELLNSGMDMTEADNLVISWGRSDCGTQIMFHYSEDCSRSFSLGDLRIKVMELTGILWKHLNQTNLNLPFGKLEEFLRQKGDDGVDDLSLSILNNTQQNEQDIKEVSEIIENFKHSLRDYTSKQFQDVFGKDFSFNDISNTFAEFFKEGKVIRSLDNEADLEAFAAEAAEVILASEPNKDYIPWHDTVISKIDLIDNWIREVVFKYVVTQEITGYVNSANVAEKLEMVFRIYDKPDFMQYLKLVISDGEIVWDLRLPFNITNGL